MVFFKMILIVIKTLKQLIHNLTLDITFGDNITIIAQNRGGPFGIVVWFNFEMVELSTDIDGFMGWNQTCSFDPNAERH